MVTACLTSKYVNTGVRGVQLEKDQPQKSLLQTKYTSKLTPSNNPYRSCMLQISTEFPSNFEYQEYNNVFQA